MKDDQIARCQKWSDKSEGAIGCRCRTISGLVTSIHCIEVEACLCRVRIRQDGVGGLCCHIQCGQVGDNGLSASIGYPDRETVSLVVALDPGPIVAGSICARDIGAVAHPLISERTGAGGVHPESGRLPNDEGVVSRVVGDGWLSVERYCAKNRQDKGCGLKECGESHGKG